LSREFLTVLDGELAVVELPVEAVLFLASVCVSGVEGLGPARRALCELRQDREVAAAAEQSLVRQISLS